MWNALGREEKRRTNYEADLPVTARSGFHNRLVGEVDRLFDIESMEIYLAGFAVLYERHGLSAPCSYR